MIQASAIQYIIACALAVLSRTRSHRPGRTRAGMLDYLCLALAKCIWSARPRWLLRAQWHAPFQVRHRVAAHSRTSLGLCASPASSNSDWHVHHVQHDGAHDVRENDEAIFD